MERGLEDFLLGLHMLLWNKNVTIELTKLYSYVTFCESMNELKISFRKN